MSQTLQNVNLYLPEFRKKKYWLDAEKMVLLVGAAVVVLVITSGVEYFQLAQLRKEVVAKEAQRQEIAAATAALIDQYGVQTEDPALLANIQELEEGLQSKQALLQFLEGRDLGNAEGFSEHLADLSRYHVQGLSLNHVSLADGGRSIELAGQVLRAELVTLYMQNLSNGDTYAGTDFEMLKVDEEPAAGSEPTATDMARWNFQVRSLNPASAQSN